MSAPVHILVVPQGMILPQIEKENLRISALMDQTARQPFTERHLNLIGKCAYDLGVSLHLFTTCPGVPNIKSLQEILTAPSEVKNLAVQFGLDKSLSFRAPQVPSNDYDPVVEAFYAWMGAVMMESGMTTIFAFTSSLIGANQNSVHSIQTWHPQPLGNMARRPGNLAEDRENGAPPGPEVRLMPATVERSPSKRKLSYSGSCESFVGEPEEAPFHAGLETMKRRKLARGKPKFHDSDFNSSMES
ncbi:hypothetical protein TWF281_004350 [Arthrobotrys megalospora]